MLNGAAVSWKSKRQSVVALSSAEAEFVAASSMVQEVIYARRLLEKLGFPQPEPTVIYKDNRTRLHRLVGPGLGGLWQWVAATVPNTHKKHIDLREHFVYDAGKATSLSKVLNLEAVASEDNVADLLTKPLAKALFQLLRKLLMGL